MKITATKVKVGDLKPGDLFSDTGPDKWDASTQSNREFCVLGVQVYIRTDDQCPESRVEEDIYRITIERED